MTGDSILLHSSVNMKRKHKSPIMVKALVTACTAVMSSEHQNYMH